MEKLKNVSVRNPRNMLVQLPFKLLTTWGLSEGDSIDVMLSDDGKSVVLVPRKGDEYAIEQTT